MAYKRYLKVDDGYVVADEQNPSVPKPTKAVGYIRVSTNQKAGEDRLGREVQEQAILEFAKQNNYEIVQWFSDNASGVSEHRKDLDTILFTDELEKAGVKAVIAFKSDRIARDIKLYFYYLFVLEKRKIKLLSVKEQFEDDEYGLSSVFRSLMLFVAEQERKNITIRTSGGRKIKAEQGGYAGGKTPYGYTVFNKKMVIDEKEAEIVRMIFWLRSQGCVLQEICDIINDKGYRTRVGHTFTSTQISRILHYKPVYEGFYRYGKMNKWVKGQHEPILVKRVSSIPEIEIMAQGIEDEKQEAEVADNATSELNEDVEVAEDDAVEQEANVAIEDQNEPVKPSIDIEDMELDEIYSDENIKDEPQETLQDEPSRPVTFIGGVFGS